MKRYISTPLTLLSLCICAVLLGVSQSATAYNYLGEIICKSPNCGIISNAPKTSLLSIDPDPFPTVDQGDPQDITVKWSVRLGLRAKFELCATDSLSSGPQSGDSCIALPRATVINNGIAGTTYEDALTLDSTFYQPTAEFYIRTTALINLIGSTPNLSFSNRLVFVWPLTLPNLFAHKAHPDVGKDIRIRHDISNRGPVDAGFNVTQLVVNVCDGIAMLLICNEKSAYYLTTFTVQQSVNYVAAGTRERNYTDITSFIRPFAGRYGLWLSITAYVDAQQNISESNETDNVRINTQLIMP